MQNEAPVVLAVVGATATGKSALALHLAEALGGEIVNADALQVYRGFDIGTGKPTAEERRRVPHHLVDILEPGERFSAGDFARRARAAIAAIRSRGKLPILAGGSGLYVRAALDGISPLPPRQPELRAAIEERLRAEGPAALRAELARLDPVSAARLSDRQRLVRAIEVVHASGEPLSRWLARRPPGERRLPAARVGLTLPRAILYDRIADRVRRMAECGWVEEVAKLLASGLDPSLPAFQAIGYRQLARHLLEGWRLEEALAATVLATRRYAKRQETWFRGDPEIAWFAAETLGGRWPEVLAIARRVGAGEGQ